LQPHSAQSTQILHLVPCHQKRASPRLAWNCPAPQARFPLQQRGSPAASCV
ncbi:hypothetical protein PMIN06_012407, partial [Paraphaeosphaeria minitans]